MEADERREKDRMKRQLRKERKERERREMMARSGDVDQGAISQDNTNFDSLDDEDGETPMGGDEVDDVDINDLRYDIDNPAIEQYVLSGNHNDINVYDENINFEEQI